ncbi:MAG: SH3 domain-containing protein [Acutalibacteraceae bacterium]
MKTGKRLLAFMLCVMLCISTLPLSFVSAEAVVPRAIQRQWETQWKSVYYGGKSVYDTACGIFSIVNAVGFVTGNEMSVTEVCQWAYDIKAYNYSSGGTIRGILYPKLQAKYGEQYGFTVDCGSDGGGYWEGASSTRLKNHLASGGVAIGHVYGHFIAVLEYDSSTGKYHIYDSAPSSSRGTNTYGTTGLGDCWVTQSWLSTSTKLTLDWFCLVTPTFTVINRDYGQTGSGGTTASKLGTYQITADATDPLNVRTGPATSYDIVTTLANGDIVKVTELSGNWGKLITEDGTEGWASLATYGKYIGVDAMAYSSAPNTNNISYSFDANGRLTIINNSTDQGQFDLLLPQSLGTITTPYLSLKTTPLSGNGYYFGLTHSGSGYWMMRDCNSGDELVNAATASYMTTEEQLEISILDWWKPEQSYRIDQVRFYLAPNSSIRIEYCYFATATGLVKDTTYNLMTESVNKTLMQPDAIVIPDTSKLGSYVYDNGKLTVTADTTDGFELEFDINEAFAVADLKRFLLSADSTVPFNVTLTVLNTNGTGTVSLAADYCYNFMDEFPTNGLIPAWSGTTSMDLYSYFSYNNVIPADGMSAVQKVKVTLGAAGTATFYAIQIADSNAIVTYADGVYKTGSSVNTGNVTLKSKVYTLDNGLVTGVNIGTVADFVGNVISDYTVAVYENDTAITAESPLKTGQVVKVTDGAQELVSYEIVVRGDVNCDGKIGTDDVRVLLRALTSMDSSMFTTAQLRAGDYNANGETDTIDARELVRVALA